MKTIMINYKTVDFIKLSLKSFKSASPYKIPLFILII